MKREREKRVLFEPLAQSLKEEIYPNYKVPSNGLKVLSIDQVQIEFVSCVSMFFVTFVTSIILIILQTYSFIHII